MGDMERWFGVRRLRFDFSFRNTIQEAFSYQWVITTSQYLRQKASNHLILLRSRDRTKWTRGCSPSRPRSKSLVPQEGFRTPDPIITNDVLYQLSYCGMREEARA